MLVITRFLNIFHTLPSICSNASFTTFHEEGWISIQKKDKLKLFPITDQATVILPQSPVSLKNTSNSNIREGVGSFLDISRKNSQMFGGLEDLRAVYLESFH